MAFMLNNGGFLSATKIISVFFNQYNVQSTSVNSDKFLWQRERGRSLLTVVYRNTKS